MRSCRCESIEAVADDADLEDVCNTERQLEMWEAQGLRAVFCSNNSFIFYAYMMMRFITIFQSA